jgi:ribosomal protein L10
MPSKNKDPQTRKDKVWSIAQMAVVKYSRCLFVNVDNVTSKQICVMRKSLRDMDALMVMGKNVSGHANSNFRPSSRELSSKS